ncbi:hypothetical protein [Nocardiopsis composta]|uniref:Uncharacterized protein n=1 Tax=Nocardiopsis composta TaxID=157465 RepID=A0A7W8QHP7_9ACTN|nr:hypothetical protein [Nocardiopsis composta]MBB5430546.1 hypothetical protein [Nocardiopsis composta]
MEPYDRTLSAGDLKGRTTVTDTGGNTAVIHAGPVRIRYTWNDRAALIQLASAAMQALTIVDGDHRMEH